MAKAAGRTHAPVDRRYDAAERGGVHRREHPGRVDLVERSYGNKSDSRNSALRFVVQQDQRCHVIDIARLIQSSVAPVFLLTGVAATLSVLTNRLARIVDRARNLEEQLASHPSEAPHLHGDLAVLSRRAAYMYVAISLCTIAALLVALVVVTLFANAFFASELSVLIALLFVGAMVCLSAAYVAFFIEVRIAVATLRIGIRRA
jgi:Protein of unknown function (DUF2721)